MPISRSEIHAEQQSARSSRRCRGSGRRAPGRARSRKSRRPSRAPARAPSRDGCTGIQESTLAIMRVPVDQQVEGDDRRDDQERDQPTISALPPDQSEVEETGDPSGGARRHAAQLLLRIRQLLADETARASPGSALARSGGPARNIAESCSTKFAICSPSTGTIRISAIVSRKIITATITTEAIGTAEAQPLQPLDQRIEQIGEHHAGDERQQHVVQQPQQGDEDQQRADPENELAPQRDLAAGKSAAERRPGRYWSCS